MSGMGRDGSLSGRSWVRMDRGLVGMGRGRVGMGRTWVGMDPLAPLSGTACAHTRVGVDDRLVMISTYVNDFHSPKIESARICDARIFAGFVLQKKNKSYKGDHVVECKDPIWSCTVP